MSVISEKTADRLREEAIIGCLLGTAVGDSLGLPAGIGLTTLKGIGKMWLGVKPTRSGVFSAGNGPAMRSSILGVVKGVMD